MGLRRTCASSDLAQETPLADAFCDRYPDRQMADSHPTLSRRSTLPSLIGCRWTKDSREHQATEMKNEAAMEATAGAKKVSAENSHVPPLSSERSLSGSQPWCNSFTRYARGRIPSASIERLITLYWAKCPVQGTRRRNKVTKAQKAPRLRKRYPAQQVPSAHAGSLADPRRSLVGPWLGCSPSCHVPYYYFLIARGRGGGRRCPQGVARGWRGGFTRYAIF